MYKKDNKFILFEKYQQDFDLLKYKLTNTPILKLLNLYKYFLVCINANDEGLGGVLMLEGHLVAYESKTFKDHENNYATHELELATIFHAQTLETPPPR